MWTLPFLNKLSKSQRLLWHLNKKMCSFGNQDFQQGQTILVEEEYVKQDQQREAAETYSLLHVLWCGEQNPFCAKKSAPLIQSNPIRMKMCVLNGLTFALISLIDLIWAIWLSNIQSHVWWIDEIVIWPANHEYTSE